MDEKCPSSKGKKITSEVIVIPFQGQGHVNTMLQFAKRLAWKGAGSIHITLATTHKMIKSYANNTSTNNTTIDLLSIYDDTHDTQLNFLARLAEFEAEASKALNHHLSTTTPRPSLVVYDANLPWVLDLAKQHGVPAAAYFAQSCAYVASLCLMFQEYYHKEENNNDSNNPPSFVVMPSPEDLTHGIKMKSLNSHSQLHSIAHMVISHLSNIHLADWVLFNSFDHLDDELIKWMEKLWPSTRVRTIGPTIPSAYLDKRIEYDIDYGFNLYKPTNDLCMKWLSTQQSGSVVYVAFGSVTSFSVEQMAEIGEALKHIPAKFLWVVRENDQEKLPKNFLSETSHKGLVLSWCPQLDVLAHDAVGCYITHCGWNSMLEALCFGVPILAMPLFLDQVIDAHFVDQVWDFGIRAKANEKKVVTCQEIKHCLEEIIHGKKALKIKENVEKAKNLANEALGIGGSSDKHIDEIIAQLTS